MNVLHQRNVLPATAQPSKPPSNHVIEVKSPPTIYPDDLAKLDDFRQVCRICASVAKYVLPLYLYEGEKFDIVNKIQKYLPIKLSEKERMPQGICAQCAAAVLSWHELVRGARLADVMLRRRLGAPAAPPEPRPSEAAGSEVSRNGVNENLLWKIVDLKEEPLNLCDEPEEASKQTSAAVAKDVEPGKVIITENGKRYVSCGTCKKNVATSLWQRHARAHRGERRYSCTACGLAFADSGNLARHARARHARLRPHACAHCARAFARRTHLLDHLRSHRDARDFVCDVCGKASKSAAALRMHRRTHDAPCKFQCMECGSKFKRNAELKAHVTVHTGERAHRCGCGRAFRLRGQLTVHARTHDARPKADGYVDAGTDAPQLPVNRRCTLCPLTVPARRFNSHITKKHSSKMFRCDECHTYLDKEDLLFHMNNHAFQMLPDHLKDEYYKNEKAILEEEARMEALAETEIQKLKEYFRKRDEERKRDQLEKRETEQMPVEKMEECKENIEVKTVGQAKEKKKRDINIEPVTIQNSEPAPPPTRRRRTDPQQSSESEISPAKGQRKTKRTAAAKVAKQTIEMDDEGNEGDDEVNTPAASPGGKTTRAADEPTEKSPRASRTCPICGKQYRAPSSYFYHMKYFHKRSREHECPVCNKRFGTKANLTQHASTHTGAYELECKECGKRFKSKPSLYIHEQSHGGPKRWACAQCGRSFRWRTHLARHATRHAAERAHVCGTCGRGFSVRCDLLRHARTHAADEFHCAQCGIKFAQKRYLQVHVMKKHPEVPPPAAPAPPAPAPHVQTRS